MKFNCRVMRARGYPVKLLANCKTIKQIYEDLNDRKKERVQFIVKFV